MSDGKTQAWRCIICGYVHSDDAPPQVCPICGVGPEDFKPYKEMLVGLDLDQDPTLNPDPEPDPKPAEPPSAKMWGCRICSYIHREDQPPDICPLCGAGPDQFDQGNDAAEPAPGSGT